MQSLIRTTKATYRDTKSYNDGKRIDTRLNIEKLHFNHSEI